MPEARHGRPEATGDGDGDGDAEARLPALSGEPRRRGPQLLYSLRSPVPLPRRVQKPAHHERAEVRALFTIEGKRECMNAKAWHL